MKDPLEAGQGAIVKRLIRQITPSDHPVAQSLAEALATFEHRQAEAIVELIEAVDLDEAHGHDAPGRRDALLDMADALLDDELLEWWLEQVGEAGIENTDDLAKYVGLEAEQWEEQKRDWYQRYHEAGVLDVGLDELEDDDPIDQVADRHTSERFNLDREEFREEIVEWSKGDVVEEMLGGVLDRHTLLIRESVDAIEELQEENDRLREQLEDDVGEDVQEDVDDEGDT